jgi:hypothetical protein
MKTKLLFLATVIFLATGCASTKMLDRANQEVEVPTADKAQLIFMRSSSFGGAVQSTVFNITSTDPEFIGILSYGKKLSYAVDPGKHVFMVIGESADFMEANLAGGKTYYAMVTPRMGAWKTRFSMKPVRNGVDGEFQYESDRFQGWLKKTSFVENTPESIAWFNANLDSIVSKQTEYWEVWQEKSAEDLAERTLNPDDGV